MSNLHLSNDQNPGLFGHHAVLWKGMVWLQPLKDWGLTNGARVNHRFRGVALNDFLGARNQNFAHSSSRKQWVFDTDCLAVLSIPRSASCKPLPQKLAGPRAVWLCQIGTRNAVSDEELLKALKDSGKCVKGDPDKRSHVLIMYFQDAG